MDENISVRDELTGLYNWNYFHHITKVISLGGGGNATLSPVP